MQINTFLLFWVSIGSMCSSGKRVVSIVVTPTNLLRNLMASECSMVWTHLSHCLTLVCAKRPKVISLYEEIIVWIRVVP